MARIIKSLTFGTGTRAGRPADYPIRHRLQVGGALRTAHRAWRLDGAVLARFVAGLMILCAIVVQEHLAKQQLNRRHSRANSGPHRSCLATRLGKMLAGRFHPSHKLRMSKAECPTAQRTARL